MLEHEIKNHKNVRITENNKRRGTSNNFVFRGPFQLLPQSSHFTSRVHLSLAIFQGSK